MVPPLEAGPDVSGPAASTASDAVAARLVRRLGAALERWRRNEPLGTGALEAEVGGAAAEDEM